MSDGLDARVSRRMDESFNNVIASASEAIHFETARKNGLLRRFTPRNDESQKHTSGQAAEVFASW
jgi:hypothetical protein